MSDGDGNFIVGYIMGRRRAERGPDKPYVRKTPKMPAMLWRKWAVACAAIPALVVFAITEQIGFAIGGAVVGLAVGMYIVESVWIKHHYQPDE